MGVMHAPDEVCVVCNTRFADHGERRHAFTAEGQPLVIEQPSKKQKEQAPQVKVVVAATPDLVLRQTLLRKGLITTEDLEEVERELTLGLPAATSNPSEVLPLSSPDE